MNESILKIIKDVTIKSNKSAKTGSTYYTINIQFNNYEYKTFINNDQKYIIEKLLDDFVLNADSKKSFLDD